jgi:transcriptional regulator with XRE-family HTH domain
MTSDGEKTEIDWYADDRATFGDRVVVARQALGWEQKHLAKRLGVKLKTVQGWEDDISEPRANKLQMLAGILNVSLIWLLTGEGEGINPPAEETMPAEIKELLTQMRQLRCQMKNNLDQMALLEKRIRKSVLGHL